MALRKRKNSRKQKESRIAKAHDSVKAHSVAKNFHIEFKNEVQGAAWSAFQEHDVLFLIGPAGTGKALTLKSKLYTRNGPIYMADAKVGLEIANPDGSFSKITGVFPQGEKQICRVHFSDETYVDCCEDHLWSVSHSDNLWKNKVVDTLFLEKNCRRKDGKRVLSIETTKPVNFDRKNYIIPPYVMGILLSEGNITNTNVVFTSCEKQILQKVISLIPEGYVCKSKGIDHRIVKEKRSSKINLYKEELKKLELWGCKSYQKFIPDIYKYGSIDQRIAILQGLMDGDGTIDKNGSISYSTTSFELAKDFCQLIYSLGGATKIKNKKGSIKKDGTHYRNSYRCHVNLPAEINVFLLDRKLRLAKARIKYFPKRYVSSVERLGLEQMQCISVDHAGSLYLTDNFTVTHNTHLAAAFAIQQVLNKQRDKIVLTRPIVEAGESLGFLPGEFEDKVHPYMMPLFDCMDQMVGREGLWRERIDAATEIAPIAFMRGRTFNNAVCIFDEAQNASMLQLKLFLTRFGDNSKIIITGDPTQSDIGGKVALVEVMQRLKGVDGIGFIEFKNNSIVRHPLVGKIIDRLEI